MALYFHFDTLVMEKSISESTETNLHNNIIISLGLNSLPIVKINRVICVWHWCSHHPYFHLLIYLNLDGLGKRSCDLLKGAIYGPQLSDHVFLEAMSFLSLELDDFPLGFHRVIVQLVLELVNFRCVCVFVHCHHSGEFSNWVDEVE